jgi:hypothetical protein
MPFRTLSSPKKLGNHAAEIVALAPLESARLVAAVTTDPVKVAAHAIGGGPVKVTNVSLDEVSAAAMINKKVAVVKSGDDLWALLDIQHTPKMEQVGRDIRSLHACPAGETALAVGWDGNGAALAFQNNEVGGRQFVLRGDLRTVSLRDGICYVVATASSDTAGAGGQLRLHAGTTPESGATARADLPAAASGFDLLAGGHELSALTKRGADSVCVVVREGASALTVKMMSVAGGVADVAVISSSLFVLGQDGKLRLFAADALAQADDGAAPSATFELEIRAQGQPSVLTATTTGGNKLWIGTRSGDVIRCDAIKGSLDV